MFKKISKIIALIAVKYLSFYCFLMEFRLVLFWFIPVNTSSEPLKTIWELTEFGFKFCKNCYPYTYGIQITPIINMRVIKYIISVLRKNYL